MINDLKVAVVIPSYKVKRHILDVLGKIGKEVDRIYVVDDCCPDGSGNYVKENNSDERVEILYNITNLGVGGAVKRGYAKALDDDMDVIVKLDGDGQMNPADIGYIVNPIVLGDADYTKGNRFSQIEDVEGMPGLRLLGNGVLSLLTKFSSGYWNLFDPTNGYTAIHKSALKMLPLDKISNRYFFESDILFRLNTIRAVVVDVPMKAIYADEISNIKVMRTVPEFIGNNFKNLFKRIIYNYFLRNFTISSLELLFGLILTVSGLIFGSAKWHEALASGVPASTGNVVLPALMLILGFQLLLSFLNYDIENQPDYPLQLKLFRK